MSTGLLHPKFPFSGKLTVASQRGSCLYITDLNPQETHKIKEANSGYPYNYNNPTLMVNFGSDVRCGKGAYFKRIHCDMFMVKVVLEGSMRLLNGEKKYLLKPGDLFFIRRNRDCEYTAGPDGFFRKTGINISGMLLDSVLTAAGLDDTDVIHLSDPDTIISLMHHALQVLKERPSDYLLQSSAIAFELLMRLGSENNKSVQEMELIRAQDFIRRNLFRTIHPEEIAQAAGCGIVKLNAVFRRNLGTTPVAYQLAERLREVEALLLNTDYSIKEIAEMTGYSSAIYLSNDFRKHCSCSPREYRKRNFAMPSDPASQKVTKA